MVLKGSLVDLARASRRGDVWSCFCYLRRQRITTVEKAVHLLYPDGLVPVVVFDAICDALELAQSELDDEAAQAWIVEHCL